MRVFGPLVAAALSIAAACPLAMAASAEVDQSRETLAANDGWGAATTGTTGGAAADAAHVFVVSNRSELVTALNSLDATPKIIKVLGTIEGNVDDANNPLTCDDYARGTGYSLS